MIDDDYGDLEEEEGWSRSIYELSETMMGIYVGCHPGNRAVLVELDLEASDRRIRMDYKTFMEKTSLVISFREKGRI